MKGFVVVFLRNYLNTQIGLPRASHLEHLENESH